nr:MAG TPA: hypothetical protein [Caudoviricetes sp.]
MVRYRVFRIDSQKSIKIKHRSCTVSKCTALNLKFTSIVLKQ